MFFKPNEFEYKLLKDNYQNLVRERDELLKRCEIAEQTATEYQNMIERTKEHYENRIRLLTARSEVVNANLIKKAKRNLNKIKEN